MKKSDVAALVKKQRELSKRGLSRQYENSTLCYNYYNNGNDEVYKDYIQFSDTDGGRKRALVNFNSIQQNVDAVVGFAVQNRRRAKYVARPTATGGQEVYSKNMNSLYDYHRENENADQVETDQDTDMFVGGVGTTDTDLSYIVGNATTDPNGEIIKSRIPPDRSYWDPNARSKNLLDSRWAGYSEDFELKEALDLFQGSKEDDFEQVSDEEPGDTGYQYNPWGGLYNKIKLLDTVEWAAKDQEMVRVYNHQWMQYETFYKAKNPLYSAETYEDASFIKMRMDIIKSEIENNYPDGIEAQDMFEFDPLAIELIFDEKTKTVLDREFDDLIVPVDFKRKVFYTAVVSGDHVFTYFKSICQQGFSIKFKTGVYNESGRFWMGIVNPMIEPAKYKNKALTEFIFTIASLSKGGVMVEEDAVEDIADFESKYAKTDAVITVASGALSAGKIQEKARPALPTGLDNIIMLSDAALAAAGVDPSFVGQLDNDDQSGILFKRRVKQVAAKMSKYFDSITLAQKEDARLHADLIRVWVQNNNGQWVRITGDQGKDEFLQVSEDIMAAEYDVTIMEAPQSSEDKQQIAAVLGTYGDKVMMTNPQAGLGLLAESIQMLPIDGDMKARISQLLVPQQEEKIDPALFQQLQQENAMLKSEATQSEVRKNNSESELKTAQARQTMANVRVLEAKVPLTTAQTAKTLEEAAHISSEAHIAQNNEQTPSKVSVSV